jgi:thioredoxin-like negative regulator of GroEL
MIRRQFLAAAAALVLTAPAAMAMETYSKAVFDQMMASGQPVVVHVHAAWCPVCKAQEPTLASLARDEATRGAKQVRVDFDKDKDFLRAHNVPSQSVILVFKGGKETGRVAGRSKMDEVKPVIVAGLR